MSSSVFLGSHPASRPRRLRQEPWIRDLVAESRLSPADFIWPIFVAEGAEREPVPSMPGVDRLSIPTAVAEARRAAELGIPAVAIFPYAPMSDRSEDGERAVDPDNLMCRAISAIKDAVPRIGIVADVALDPYTSHGHDGVIRNGRIANDETVEILCRQAIVQARAGADIVAPSDMMDGRIGAIRGALDAEGLADTMIMSYAAKYASAFYGPFRDAIGSTGALKGDKKTYQMDPANTDEALREVALDLAEGADMVMVKPGLPYIDVLRRVHETFRVPTFVYQVSGEYAMLRAAGERGWLDWDRAIVETLLAFKRAGAAGILTYAAPEVATRLFG